MFGLSFSELVVIGVVALLAVGPHKLPGLLRTLGIWARKARLYATNLRRQSGIDDILRSEGLHQTLSDLRSVTRTAPPPRPVYTPPPPREDPYQAMELDLTREYPPEGPDAYHALPDDLIDEEPKASSDEPEKAPDEAPEKAPTPA